MTVKFLKLNKWWTSHFGIMISFIYLVTALGTSPPTVITFASRLILFVIATVGIATFGQLLNDLMDIQQDLRTGAPNTMARRSISQRVLLFVFVILLGTLPWFWLPVNGTIISLLILEYLLFILYSAPPIRLKSRGLWGVFADSLYGYVITNAVAILTFAQLAGSRIVWLTLIAGTWMLFFGIGHIIQHQLLDACRDHVDRINTYVVINGWTTALNLLKSVIVPLDFIMFIGFLMLIYDSAPLIFLLFIVHVGFLASWWQQQTCTSILQIRALPDIHQISLLSNYVMAEFAWHWLPPLSLITLIIANPHYLVLAPFHFMLFPRPMQLLIKKVLIPAVRKTLLER